MTEIVPSLSRRGLITGLISLAVTAPAIVRSGVLMPVRVIEPFVGYYASITLDEYVERFLKLRFFAEVNRRAEEWSERVTEHVFAQSSNGGLNSLLKQELN